MISFLKNMLDNKKTDNFFFIHIPKTAGTSFINVLDANFDLDEIFPVQLWHEINQEIVDNKSKYKLIRGHFGGGSHKLLSHSKPNTLTILRHPESLSLSTYHFIKREKNTAVHQLLNDKKMEFQDFLEEPLTAHKINNRMVRHLSFDLQQDPEAQELFLSAQSVRVVSSWIKAKKKIKPEKRLSRAIKALDQCTWFGILEKFDQSLQLFSYTFNQPPIGRSPNLNAYNPSQTIDNHCKNLITDENEYDLALYNYALKKFENLYQDMCNQLKKLPNAQNKSTDELIDLKYKLYNHKKNKSINFDFGQRHLGSGWHRRELTLPEKSYFRWTNCNEAFLDFWMEKSDYNLSIRIINAISIDHLENLVIMINQHQLSYEYDIKEGVVRMINAHIPHSLLENNLMRIRFSHPKIVQHKHIFDSNDERYLGIAVNWIKIEPCHQ